MRFNHNLLPGLILVGAGLVFILIGILVSNVPLDAMGLVLLLFGAIDTVTWLKV